MNQLQLVHLFTLVTRNKLSKGLRWLVFED